MKYSIDGGVTFHEAINGVELIYEKVFVSGEDEEGELHINATSEGLIYDVWVSRDEPLDHNIGTDSQLVERIVEQLVDENA